MADEDCKGAHLTSILTVANDGPCDLVGATVYHSEVKARDNFKSKGGQRHKGLPFHLKFFCMNIQLVLGHSHHPTITSGIVINPNILTQKESNYCKSWSYSTIRSKITWRSIYFKCWLLTNLLILLLLMKCKTSSFVCILIIFLPY